MPDSNSRDCWTSRWIECVLRAADGRHHYCEFVLCERLARVSCCPGSHRTRSALNLAVHMQATLKSQEDQRASTASQPDSRKKRRRR